MLSGYRLVWMMVIFDLPVIEQEERKAATGFRNFLLDQGFEMAQYSVYLRFCSGKEHVETLSRRIEEHLPGSGKIDILVFTDKQYENIVSFHGKEPRTDRKKPDQFSLF